MHSLSCLQDCCKRSRHKKVETVCHAAMLAESVANLWKWLSNNFNRSSNFMSMLFSAATTVSWFCSALSGGLFRLSWNSRCIKGNRFVNLANLFIKELLLDIWSHLWWVWAFGIGYATQSEISHAKDHSLILRGRESIPKNTCSV